MDAEESASAWRPAIASALMALALYAVTLAGTYVYDDQHLVLGDPRIGGDERVRQPGRWVDYLRHPYFPYAPDPLWRPLPSLSYALHWRLHEDLAWPVHLVNILLHAGVSALVAELARRLTKQVAVAWIAGLLFAAHPVHVEAVAYLVGRAETLCALGVVGGLVIYGHKPLTGPRVLAIVGCFVLAVLSKEHGLLLGPMLLIWFLCERYLGRDRLADAGGTPVPRGGPAVVLDYGRPAPRRGGQAPLLLTALCCFVVFAYVAYRESIMHLLFDKWFLRWTVNPIVRAHGVDRALIPVSILGRYLALLIFPAKLSPDYGANVTTYTFRVGDPYFYVGAIGVLTYVAALLMAVRRRAVAVVICLLCLVASYVLISNTILVIGTVMGERLIYLGSVFFIILIAVALARLPGRVRVVCPAIILVLLSIRTVTYAWRWNDALRLFHVARIESPDSVYLHVLEAEELMERGRLEEAEVLLARAREICPESQNAWAVSAKLAELQGRGDEEIRQYKRRAFDLAENPPHMPARTNGPYRPRGTSRPAGP